MSVKGATWIESFLFTKKKKQKKNETEHDDGWAEEKDTLQCRWKKRTDLRAEKIINDFKEDYETVRQN